MNSFSRVICLTLAAGTIAVAAARQCLAEDGAAPTDATDRWVFNFRNPSYCKMILCNGSCANTSSDADPGCRLVPLYPLLRATNHCAGGCCSGR